MLAVRVGLINELAELAEKTGASIDEVAAIVGADHRIGSRFLVAGPGFGGSCFPKDLRALAAAAPTEMTICRALIESNERQTRRLAAPLERALGGLDGRRIAVWGLAFKAGTDDARQSPSLALVDELTRRGAVVTAADPMAIASALEWLPTSVAISTCVYEAANDVDAIVVMTGWPEFAAADLGRVARTMRGRLLLDARRVIDAVAAREAGLDLRQLGLASAAPSFSGQRLRIAS